MENCAACSFLDSLVENVELEVILCYVMLCYVMLCYVMLYNVMSCCLRRNYLTIVLLVPVSMWVIS